MDARRFSRTPNLDSLGNPNPGVFPSPPLDHRRGSEPVSADVPSLMKLHVRVIPIQPGFMFPSHRAPLSCIKCICPRSQVFSAPSSVAPLPSVCIPAAPQPRLLG